MGNKHSNSQATDFFKGFDDGLVGTVGGGGSFIKKIAQLPGAEELYPLGAGLEEFATIADRHNYENDGFTPRQKVEKVGESLLEKSKRSANPNDTQYPNPLQNIQFF
jgi:hypothetical protein